MLSPQYLKTVTDELENYFYDIETTILCDIAERIRLNSGNMTATAQYQINQVKALGVTNDKINKYLSEALEKSHAEVEKIIANSAYKSVQYDNVVFKEAFDEGLISSFSFDKNNLKDLIAEGVALANSNIENICNTTAVTAQQKLLSSMNNAYLQIQSGAFTADYVVDRVVTQLSKEGLSWIDYESGTHRRLDTTIRSAVRTSINQTAAKCQLQNMEYFGCNLVEVTSHMGARPSHAEWQGKIFWYGKPVDGYESLINVTGYGTTVGLCGVNCRHSFYPFMPGISEKSFTHYDTDENEELYNLQQEQRYNERMIREWSRRKKVKNAAGCDTQLESSKVHYWKSRNDTLINSDDRLKHNYAMEKSYVSSMNGKINISDIKISGALDPYSKKAGKHAEQYYESVRKMKTDCKKISMNTGYSEDLIKKIKRYAFVDEHNLITGRKRFDPDYHMSQSWQRLIEGKSIQKHDLLLLEHEMYEIILVESGISQMEAHNITNEIYNYKKGCDEYYGIFKKFHKK